MISAEYEKSGIKGEQYIKKIIQIPIMVPEWNSNDLGNLLENDIAEKLDDTYSKIIKENKALISVASESNPRELKRFINNFIVSNEIFSLNKEIHPQQLLAIQALKVRWPAFYRDLTSIFVDFHNAVEKYVSMKNEDRIRELRETKARESDVKNVDREVEQRLLEIDTELWNFLDKAKQIIFSINNWEIYRRAAESTKADLMTPATIASSTPTVSIFGYTQNDYSNVKLLELLQMGKVTEFNNRRKNDNSRHLEFPPS